MTKQEAIKWIKDHFLPDEHRLTNTNHDVAMSIAIECIEKQIPRKPIEEQMEVSEEWQKLFDGIDGEVTCYQYRCPVCENTTLDKGFDYCPNCGTKLDWSDNE